MLFPLLGLAQEGVVTGTLTTDDDGLPLPGASIVIKGTSNGVQTDFDGKYNIKCNVGDIIVISYVGMTSKEIRVTADMFGVAQQNYVERIPVKPIESDAYNNALKSIKKQSFKTLTIEDSKHTYNKKGYNAFSRIKAITINSENVDLTYFNPDIYFQVGVKSNLSFRFVKDRNLPKLQSSFSQGAAENGALYFLGPETGNSFSYGPNLNTLEYDGSNYNFDSNGRLVPLGSGNGDLANTYNNTILNTAINRFTNIYFNVDTDRWTAGIDFSNKNTEDAFGLKHSKRDNIVLSFDNKRHYDRKLTWKSFVKLSKWINNQPNINAFTNNLLINSWITPVSFENSQGTVLLDNNQRSFSPTNYNNPEWLLNNNKNYDANDLFVFSLENEFKIIDDLSLESQLNYKTTTNEQNFGLVANTIGYEEGYLSNKTIKRKNFNVSLNLNYKKHLGDFSIDLRSVAKLRNENLDYQFRESEEFNPFTLSNPSNTSIVENKIYRNVLRLNQLIRISRSRNTEIIFSNNSHISSIQKNKLLLPTSVLKIDLTDFIDIYDFNDITLSARSAFDVNEMLLFYNNQSHNSLELLPSESFTYTSNIDLFINEDIALEEKHDYTFNALIGFRLLELNWDLSASYFGSKTKGSVFPVLENGVFQLQNIADISNKGLELQLDVNKWFDDLKLESRLSFMTNKNKVEQLYSNQERIPIAGFKSVSKNLIVDEPAGVIVGSAYARDTNNNIIIDANGFPVVDAEQQIIGDPIPDFTLGFSNRLEWKQLKFSFTLDYQKGGDVWNGTQNVLNYFGTSQQSASQRGITDFVFNGVNEQGVTNDVPVDFYNPANGIENNRFVRYGFSGVAEDAIEDASYLNLRTIELSYDFSDNNYNAFFRKFEIGIYANNLFTITKYSGASPYASLFDTNSGHNLNFFNTPLITEVGLKVNLKI
ncbi:carboxypeptidase-like regulatory domain-containing protein [uncultured Winogradskyella sp.]|uniref:carboxypeptidase-like regulatory domain-containing protein n=1 Tax=uncultured Winogradskyella sp. TaxID=395353 RepID=UPI002632B408|nr:carboxypeptidase-like regulatory domain-containing protein [uncultured Winogradskyella sp.]